MVPDGVRGDIQRGGDVGDLETFENEPGDLFLPVRERMGAGQHGADPRGQGRADRDGDVPARAAGAGQRRRVQFGPVTVGGVRKQAGR